MGNWFSKLFGAKECCSHHGECCGHHEENCCHHGDDCCQDKKAADSVQPTTPANTMVETEKTSTEDVKTEDAAEKTE